MARHKDCAFVGSSVRFPLGDDWAIERKGQSNDRMEASNPACACGREAASAGELSSVERLLEAGANPNDVENSGRTPLHSAVWADREAVARLLLEAGARRP